MLACKCGGATTVTDSGRNRHRDGQRRRKCKKCGITFITHETREDEHLSFTTEELDQLQKAIFEDLNQLKKTIKNTISRFKV